MRFTECDSRYYLIAQGGFVVQGLLGFLQLSGERHLGLVGLVQLAGGLVSAVGQVDLLLLQPVLQ